MHACLLQCALFIIVAIHTYIPVDGHHTTEAPALTIVENIAYGSTVTNNYK